MYFKYILVTEYFNIVVLLPLCALQISWTSGESLDYFIHLLFAHFLWLHDFFICWDEYWGRLISFRSPWSCFNLVSFILLCIVIQKHEMLSSDNRANINTVGDAFRYWSFLSAVGKHQQQMFYQIPDSPKDPKCPASRCFHSFSPSCLYIHLIRSDWSPWW